MTDQLAEIDRALTIAGRSPAMATLAERAGLEPAAEELLWTLATASIEARAHAHLVAALGGEIRRGLSAGAYAALADLDEAGSRTLIDLLDREHPLFRHRLLEPGEERLHAATPLVVPRRVIDHLAGRDTVDPMLSICWPPLRARLDADQRSVVARLNRAFATQQQAVIIIEGPRGAGRTSAAALVASQLGREVVVLDAASLSPTAVEGPRALAALHREVLLRDAVPVIANADAPNERDGAGPARCSTSRARNPGPPC